MNGAGVLNNAHVPHSVYMTGGHWCYTLRYFEQILHFNWD